MSSVVIAGDTSGSVTLQAPATAGSTVLTLPTTSATLITDSSGILNIGSGQLYKDASGNVGIGTSSPAKKLDVLGEAQISFNSINTYLYYQSTNNYTGRNTDGNMWMNVANPYSNIFGAGGVEKMRIDSSGNVGIGTGTYTSYGKLTVVCSGTSRANGLSVTPSGDVTDGLRLYCDGTNNPNGIIENVWDSAGATLFRDILINPSGGNVGIGSSSDNPTPAAPLHITAGTAQTAVVTAVTTQLRLARSGTGGVKYSTQADFKLGTYATGINSQTQLDIALGNGATNTPDVTVMTLLGSGNVGIGTSSPTGKLDVQGGRSYFASNSDAFASYLRYNNSTSGVFLGSPSANAFQISNSGGGAYLNINSSGNLGIGTTNPTQRLHVMGSTIFDFTHGQNIKLGVSAGNNGNTTYSGDAYLYLWTSEPGTTWTGAGIGRNIVNTSSFPRVNTNLSGQMIRFDEGDSASIQLITETKAGTRYTPLYVTNGDVFMNSGNLMIGATSSVNTNTKIYAVTAGQDDNNGIIQAYNTNSAAGNSASLMTRSYWGTGQFMSWSSNGMRIGMRQTFNGGSGQVNYTYSNDNIGFANNSSLGTGALYTNGGVLTNTNPSDARLKTDIQDITLGLDFISQLKPVSYKWLNNRANQDTQYGFIAQDVQEIEPSLVREFEAAVDIDSENSDDHKTVIRLGLEEKGIYTAMVKAIQELKAIIDTQQEQINSLLGK